MPVQVPVATLATQASNEGGSAHCAAVLVAVAEGRLRLLGEAVLVRKVTIDRDTGSGRDVPAHVVDLDASSLNRVLAVGIRRRCPALVAKILADRGASDRRFAPPQCTWRNFN